MLDKHRYDLAVLAYTEDKAEQYPSRQAAANAIAQLRGCSPHTADKTIRDAIYQKKIRYGFRWSYIQ